ncbi:MAG: polysaccharide deacetylase family protein [Candidatus Omnitrophica bacterium]|nr:polysaccharide deacetylase family protein [Candidatus Omnitrophota bacterium]MCM8831246.1 polysaccharide deacetylase family protein [Candidatus Omnitrophota bacterium]
MRKILKFIIVIFVLIFTFWYFLFLNYSTPILMYHSLDESKIKDYPVVSTRVFLEQMKFIKKIGYKVISLTDYCRHLKEKNTQLRNAVVITFDDGLKDNMMAVNILKDFDFTATIFLIADRIGQNGYLTEENIKWFLKNTKINIGSHTLRHLYLPDLDVDELKDEILGSKIKLQKLFDTAVDTISYPAGGFNEKVLKIVEEAGYLCACTTNRSFSKKNNYFQLRRIKITNRDLGFKLWIKLSGFYNFFKIPRKPF